MAKRLVRAVLFLLRLLSPRAWRRMLARSRRGGADRRPEQAKQATPLTERQVGSVELVRHQRQFPVEWNAEAAPDVANPAPPAGHPAHPSPPADPADPADPVHPAHLPAPRVALREELRDVLLRRAIAADAPAWRQPPAHVLAYYARRAVARTGPILPVNELMCIQVALPTTFVRALVN